MSSAPFAGRFPFLCEFFGELDDFATTAGADLDAGQEIAVEYFVEIAIGFDDARFAALEVAFGELGFNEQTAPTHIDFGAIDTTVLKWHSGLPAEDGFGF